MIRSSNAVGAHVRSLSILALGTAITFCIGNPAAAADSVAETGRASTVAAPATVAVPAAAKSVIMHDVMVPMRDGTKLAADVYLPSGDGVNPAPGRYPVLLVRTPYGKASRLFEAPPETSGAALASMRPAVANSRGYVVVMQDVRGTFGSEGKFEPMRNENADGVDTVAWLNAQPWSDGRVGTYGGSYLGGVQMLLAAEQPPGLVTAFSQVAATDQFSNEWVYRDDVLAMTSAVWTSAMVSAEVARGSKDDQDLLRADYEMLGPVEGAASPLEANVKMLAMLPLADMPVVRRAPWWSKWLQNRDNRKYFKINEMADRFDRIDIPILHLGGWYDLFQRNSYSHFKAIAAEGATPLTRQNQRLIMGPWSHGTCIGCPANSAINAEEMQLAWMDQWFKGKRNDFFDHRVVIYVMGENRWRAEADWPLPGTERTRYYLHSDGAANSAAGDGGLSTTLPGSEPADRYTYDPRNPAPTLGGPGLTGSRAIQNPAEQRADVLVYTTPPLDEDVEVTGEISATLFAASSVEDTDWWVKLVDVDENGEARILAQGVARARYRISRDDPQPLTPGKVEKYKIDLWATSNVFKKGHRIRIDITSSNFPYAERNPNAFIDISTATDADLVVASQTIFHDAGRASFVELPIIPMSREREWIGVPNPGAVEQLETP
ncbi:CocE/NonD family hydrolase [Rhizorhapis suberifaciens]|uniref:Xaa-Pro dipeptidyl-peptidase C-terminal domain-containing protein n=1 Tax=Rhizorhapis suberifaciens TaxID=13656 RepID=A0A840HTF0_9SPHN|nr:CocE/NonD family hydrolase [Rhizorhapis suberifaciens]MBB4641452.1 hypothetical protein [Rhizorhapis suberifaciens]